MSDNINIYNDILFSKDPLKEKEKEIEFFNEKFNSYYTDLIEKIGKVGNKDSLSKNIKGAITFLDVLGWKGIYKTRQTALRDLLDLVKKAEEHAYKITKESEINGTLDHNIKTYVISISDTIAILTEGDAPSTIKIHSKICSNILPISVDYKIPLRGAISYGNYKFKDNVMVGPAVDEAASWHESTDWIGVILTPTAQIHLNDNLENPIVTYDKIPFKKSFKPLNTCVHWQLSEHTQKENLILDMGPLVPEVAGKYMNTFEFLKTNTNDEPPLNPNKKSISFAM